MSFDWDIDSRRWPLTIIKVCGEPSCDQFKAFLDAVRNELAQNVGRSAYVLDIRTLRGMTARNRAILAEFRRSAKTLQLERAVAFAYLIENSVMRGILNATLWVVKPPVPLSVFVSLEDAKPFLEKHLEREGLHWPAEISEMPLRAGGNLRT